MQEILLVHLVERRMIIQDINWARFKWSTFQNILLASPYTHELYIALVSLKQLDPCLQPTLSTCLERSQPQFCWIEISFSDTERTLVSDSQRNLFLIKWFQKKVIKQCAFSMCSIVLASRGSRVRFSCSCSQWNVLVNIQWMNTRNISFLEANRMRLTGNRKRSMHSALLKWGRTSLLI